MSSLWYMTLKTCTHVPAAAWQGSRPAGDVITLEGNTVSLGRSQNHRAHPARAQAKHGVLFKASEPCAVCQCVQVTHLTCFS